MLPFSPMMMIIVGVIAVLLYGEKLPEVARSFGKQFLDFKKSLRGIQDELTSAVRGARNTLDSATSGLSSSMHASHPSHDEADDREEAIAPKFEPPPAPPKPPAAAAP